MMKEGEKCLNQGSSLMIFPEGTRSKDGKLGKFRDGAFILSQKTGSPVVPVVITGSGEVFGDGSIMYRKKYSMKISLLPPIPSDAEETPKALGRLARQTILDELGQRDE